MNWLWIAAVALLAVFFLTLLWYFFSDYQCFPCRKKRYGSSILPTYQADILPVPSAPSAPPSTPDESPTVRLTHGERQLRQIVFEENGIPTLDLHSMTVLEARSATYGFLHRQRAMGNSHIQVITGRGLHSDQGVAKIKPLVRNILIGEGLAYRETCQGGAYLIYL